MLLSPAPSNDRDDQRRRVKTVVFFLFCFVFTLWIPHWTQRLWLSIQTYSWFITMPIYSCWLGNFWMKNHSVFKYSKQTFAGNSRFSKFLKTNCSSYYFPTEETEKAGRATTIHAILSWGERFNVSHIFFNSHNHNLSFFSYLEGWTYPTSIEKTGSYKCKHLNQIWVIWLFFIWEYNHLIYFACKFGSFSARGFWLLFFQCFHTNFHAI